MNTDPKNLDVATQLTYDQSFRHKVRNKDPDALKKLGFKISEATPELNVVSSTRDITYVPLPPLSGDYKLSDSELERLQAAATSSASTIGSAGSASTLATATSTASSLGSVGSAGSAGTAGSG